MPIIEPQTFTARGWVEHYSGFPADLFYSGDKSLEPWAVKPHLHLNYAMGGALSSLTYKDAAGQNHYIFLNGNWFQGPAIGIPAETMKSEIAFIQQLT